MARSRKQKKVLHEVSADIRISVKLDALGYTPEDAEATAEEELQEYTQTLRSTSDLTVEDVEILSIVAEPTEKDEEDDSRN